MAVYKCLNLMAEDTSLTHRMSLLIREKYFMALKHKNFLSCTSSPKKTKRFDNWLVTSNKHLNVSDVIFK